MNDLTALRDTVLEAKADLDEKRAVMNALRSIKGAPYDDAYVEYIWAVYHWKMVNDQLKQEESEAMRVLAGGQ